MTEKAPYVPTVKEMRAAQEMMTRKEREISNALEQAYNYRLGLARRDGVLPEVLKNTFLTLNSRRIGREIDSLSMEGMIGGHHIFLEKQSSSTEKSFVGTIDGIKMSSADAEQVFEKYQAIAKSFHDQQRVVTELSKTDWGLVEEQEKARALLQEIL